MSTVKAELLAGEALRAHLHEKLTAKVAAINAERFAVLTAPRPGPYTVTGNIAIGTVPGSESAQVLTTGSRTTAQVVAELAAAGITASADARDRLTLTSTTAPSTGTPSTISVAASEHLAAFGWPVGGVERSRCALVAPGFEAIFDGDPDFIDLGVGFWVILGARTTAPRSSNTRDDTHTVTLSVEILASEPNHSAEAMREYVLQALRAVREVILEDRTLGGAVFKTDLPNITFNPRTFRLNTENSPLLISTSLSVRVTVFERS